MVVCDVLHVLLTPRPGQTACPIDADTAHATVQLAFQRFNLQEWQSAAAITSAPTRRSTRDGAAGRGALPPRSRASTRSPAARVASTR